ncbi:ExbD/TolR family protein [Leadbetterella sp. DM7]|uniref:ExbD/TolR family protein n=1 Tax=Leadbetterella sp. DM7 TaxID=3235085 RepID=UPI00349ED49E
MAEVQVKESGGKKGGKVRSKKGGGKPDMTPMVDLGFLLLTFFIFTTTFSKPNMMKLNMPEKTDEKKPETTESKVSNTITIVMGKDDRIFWYQKPLADVTVDDLMETDYSASGIRAEINKKRASAIDTSKFTVIIKPSNEATFENAVDILDEMEITGNKRFAIVDLMPQEQKAYEERMARPKGQ